MKKYKYRKTFTYEGKRYSVYGDTLQQVYEKMGKRMAELESGKKRISKNMTFSDWSEEWLIAYKEHTVSKETYRVYQSNLRRHILPLLGPMPIKNIKAIHCQRVLNDMSGFSAKMLNRITQLMIAIFEDALDNGLIFSNPARKLKLPKGSKSTRRAITKTERKYILQVAETHPAGVMILLMLYCGLRPAEVSALQWRHIDLDEKIISVEQSSKRSGGVGAPKSSAGIRKVPIPDKLAFRLNRINPKEPFGFVCQNQKGGRLNASSMHRRWKSFVDTMNVAMGCETTPNGKPLPPFRVADDLVPYCFRHTYCTDLRDAGVDITVARVLMGHSSIAITAHVYTHQTDVALKNAVDKINQQGATSGATP